MTFLEQVASVEGLVAIRNERGAQYLTTPGYSDQGWLIYQDDRWEFSLWEFDNNDPHYVDTFPTVEAAIKAARELK